MSSIRPLFSVKSDNKSAEGGRSLSCVSCGLYKEVLSPRMPPHGEGARRLMIVGEGPGETEDKLGKPWQGPAGRLLQDALRTHELDLARDCVSLNAVNCRPPKNRAPTNHEVSCCRVKFVDPAIDQFAPRVILLMGGSAVASVLGPLCQQALGASIGKWRGFAIPVGSMGAWVCPTYHPSYVMREEKRTEIDTIWRQDIHRALAHLDGPPLHEEDLTEHLKLLHTEDEILFEINRAHRFPLLSYDYETTGLHPTHHEIVCASFSHSSDSAYSFMMPKSGPVRAAWADLMADPDVGKISHNMKFENGWTRYHFQVSEINWSWDSMVAAHVVDNRVGICGLKIQAFLYFGIPAWDDKIEPYLRAMDDGPRSTNRIREFIERYGEDECLIYCGIDSLVAYRLALRQMEYVNGNGIG